MNSKKGRGKRFLAGFLALLMAVTLLPANVAGVAYAEELDGIETEAPDNTVAVDEEIEAADGVVEANEETDEPQVNEGESSEEVEPEEGLNAGEEDLVLEEAVPELEEAVAVASEEVLEPAEVSAAVTVPTGYEEKVNDANDTKVRSWTFNSDYWTDKGFDGEMAVGTAFDGIKVTTAKVVTKKSDNAISLLSGGKIDIPVDDDTDAITIEITLAGGANTKRYIKIGAGSKQEKVYQKDSPNSEPTFTKANNIYTYTNETLYKKTDGMFSSVLTIEGNDEDTGSKDFKIASIVLHEYKEVVEPVTFTEDTEVELSVGEGADKSTTETTYTGSPINFNVVVTNPGEDGAKTTVNSKAYSVSYYRQKTDGSGDYEETATTDLTSAGTIKAVVTSKPAEGGTATTAESKNVFTIKPATLTLATNDADGKEVISIAATQIDQYADAELDLSDLIEPLSNADTFTYTLEESGDYVAGDVVDTTTDAKKPKIDGSILTYSVDQNADANSVATVLVVKVESANYEPATIKVEVKIANKTAVTVSGNTVAHTYNGAAYGYKANADIKLLDPTLTGDALAAAIEDIKTNLTYKFTKLAADGTAVGDPMTTEPTDAGTYKVEAELSTNSNYTLTKFVGGVDEGGSDIDATLTINPKTVTIKPNDVTWDKVLKDHPTPPETVATTDYTFVGDGLVGTDTLDITGMTIKYYKHGSKTEEMQETDWAGLGEDDVVDIVADGATASDNYKIEYAVGTINVLIRTLTPIEALTAKKSTFLASAITASQIESGNVKKDSLVNGFLLTGGDGFSTKNDSKTINGTGYTVGLKSGSNGNQYYKSIGFRISKPATLYVAVRTDGGTITRKMKLSKLNASNGLDECEGVEYSKNGAATKQTYAAGGIDIEHTTEHYISMDLNEDGTYYLAAGPNGLFFYEVTVTYKEETDPNPDYNITIDRSKVATGGATVTEGDKTTAKANETVTLTDVVTVTLNTGFELKGYEVKAGGETVAVSAENTFTMPASNVSIAPIVMAAGSVVAPVATPGSTTQTTEVEKGSKVTLSVAGGDFDHIYYTTGATAAAAADPKDASADRKDYAVDSPDGIVINEAMTIKAVATKGENFSDVVIYSYTAKETQAPSTVELKSVTISGTPRVGSTLTANPVFEGTPDASKVAYAWSRVSSDGSVTPVGTTNTYTVVDADLNCSIKVVVTFTNAEGQPVTKEATVTVTASKLKGNGIEIEFDEGSTYIYTGAKITPSITVYNNGTPLVEGTDYTVRYTNNVNASHKIESDGTTLTAIQSNPKKLPTVTVTGKGNLSRPVSETFKIVPKALDNVDYTDAANTVPDVEAKGVVVVAGKKVTPVLVYGGVKLALRRNFDYKTPDDKNKNTWQDGDTLTLVGVENSNFTGETNLKVSVVERTAQADAKMSVQFTGGNNAVKYLYYTGSEHRIGFDVSTKGGLSSTSDDPEKKLVEGEDYTISYPADLINVGAKKVIITGISKKCMGSVTKSYSIKPADKTGGATFAVTGVNPNGYDYVSTGVTFDLTGDNAVTVKYVPNTSDNGRAVSADGVSLVPGKDFKITYTNNKKASTSTNTAKYTVTGLGNYKGVVLKNQPFTINPIKLIDSNTDVKVTVADVLYNKSTKYKSVPYVTVNGATLKASEYDVWYIVGTGETASETKNQTRKITDNDLTSGSLDVTVKIVPKANSKNVVGPAEGGSEAAFTEDFKIIKSTDTLTFSKDKDLSKARITFYGGADPRKDKNKVGFTGEAVYPTKMEIKFNGERVPVTLDLVNGQLKEADKMQYGFTLTYADNVAKGKATVVVTADGTKYVGGKTATFNIVAKELDKLNKDNGEGFIASFMNCLLNK